MISHFVDGKPFFGAGDRTGDVYNPATGQVAEQVAFASTEDVDAAVASAVQGAAVWREASISKTS